MRCSRVSRWTLLLLLAGLHSAASVKAGSPPALRILKEISWPELGASSVTDVAVVGDLAFVTAVSGWPASHRGLHVFDISNSERIRRLSSAGVGFEGLAIQVVGNLAYVAAGNSGLKVFDVSDPSRPRLSGSVQTRGLANALQVIGNRAYVSEHVAGIEIFDTSDVTDTNRFRSLGGLNFTGDIQDIQVAGNFAYVAAYRSGLIMFDVSNPAQIKRLVQVPTRGLSVGLKIVGSLAYVTTTNAALEVFDLSGGTNIVKLASLGTNAGARSVALDGNTAYVCRGEAGMMAFDISNRTNIVELHGQLPDSQAFKVTPNGSRMLLAAGAQGMRIYSRTAPAVMVESGAAWGAGDCRRAVREGDRVYVINSSYGLHVLELDENEELHRVGGVRISHPSRLVAEGGIAYVTDGTATLRIFDARIPSAVRMAGSVTFSNVIQDMKVRQGYAYLAIPGSQLVILDCRNPEAPVETGFHTFDTTDVPVLALAGDRLHLAPNFVSYRILDISNPPQVTLLGSQPDLPTMALDPFLACAADETYFVAVTILGECVIWNVADPAAAVFRGYVGCFSSQFVYDAELATDGRLFFAGWDVNGISVFDPVDPRISTDEFTQQCISIPSPAIGVQCHAGGMLTCSITGVTLDPAMPGIRTTLEAVVDTNAPLVVEASTNLLTWETIFATNLPSAKMKVVNWTDGTPQRFYRARQ